MADYPKTLHITEEGPREGFQIEPGPISTADKIALINALSNTGVSAIQVCSFVSPKRVPGWADADAVVAGFTPSENLAYTALWFNRQGIERAVVHRNKLSLTGTIHMVASEAFSLRNLNRGRKANIDAMHRQTQHHHDAGVAVSKISVMAAFGCNFSGDVSTNDAVRAVQDGFEVAQQHDAVITEVALADTMGWANPAQIQRVVGAVRERWPDHLLRLHLHDTRGLGIANAHAALSLGVTAFDTTVGGLGGCPFAAHADAPGNIATEELVLLAEELGIDTQVDLETLIDAGHLAERIVGHALPSAVLRGGSLQRFRARAIV